MENVRGLNRKQLNLLGLLEHCHEEIKNGATKTALTKCGYFIHFIQPQVIDDCPFCKENMRYLKGILEKRQRCPHPSLSKEFILGQRTGDKVCDHCGESFAPGEEITSIENRKGMALTKHSVIIAMTVGEGNFIVRRDAVIGRGATKFEYDYAITSKGADYRILIQVASDIAEEMIRDSSLEETSSGVFVLGKCVC